MRIIYFTTAQDEKDYRSFMNQWKIALNPSNQNFHNKLIRALAIDNKVDVISIRPFSRKNMKVKKLPAEEKNDGNISWHYLSRCGLKVFRTAKLIPEANKIFKTIVQKDSVILSDTINPSVLRTLNKINAKTKLPVIGICTDSPSNISGTSKSYTQYILSHSDNFNGYISLTQSLNDLFNKQNNPHLVVEGLVENREEKEEKMNDKPYFFFGGALMEKYGVFNLIKAFKRLHDDSIDLIICGHHGDKTKIRDEIGKNTNIQYIGLIPVKEVLKYENNCIATINPRPFSEDLDRYSIPSKTLEYMSSGRPVISVRNTILMEKFPNEIIWVNSSEVNDLEKGLKQVLLMNKKEREIFGFQSKNRVLELYSLKSVSIIINNFLKQFVS